MAAYDYRCRTCDTTFEVRRSVTDGADGVTCPRGHAEVSRVWSAVSVGGRASTPGTAAVPSGAPAGGGCCGGGCCGG